jgi:DNA-binding NarL/FixJ family response regulator
MTEKNITLKELKMKKKVMIVEDYEEMQILYSAVFRKNPHIEIVALESNAESALEHIEPLNPDLIIIDITLPGMDGIELTNIVKKQFPHMKIIVVTAHDYDRYLRIATEAGADKLVTKDNAFEILNETEKMLGLK